MKKFGELAGIGVAAVVSFPLLCAIFIIGSPFILIGYIVKKLIPDF